MTLENVIDGTLRVYRNTVRIVTRNILFQCNPNFNVFHVLIKLLREVERGISSKKLLFLVGWRSILEGTRVNNCNLAAT